MTILKRRQIPYSRFVSGNSYLLLFCILIIWLCVLLTFLFTGCNRDRGVPKIRRGQEECSSCRMLINEDRFASAYVLTSGKMRKFDDLGCAISHQWKQDKTVKKFWIHDYENPGWIEVNQAFFVHSKDLHTPMGYGIVAVSTSARADNLRKMVNGRILRFNQLEKILQLPADRHHSTKSMSKLLEEG